MIEKVEVVTEGHPEAEESFASVCCRKSDDPGYFKDNLESVCVLCNEAVIYRPAMPKKPPKVCSDCFFGLGPEAVWKALTKH